MIRAVLDTNVLISALLFNGPPSQLVPAWQTERFTPVVSPPILQEYIRVLAYPKFRLTEEEIAGLIQEELLPFVETTQTTQGHIKPVHLPSDPDDAKFLECALSANVPWIISGDKDLLNLHSFKSIKLVTTKDFLRRLDGSY